MSVDRHGLFTELEPPPGGAERLSRRLDESARRGRAPRWRLAATACAAVALVVAGLVFVLDGLRSVDVSEPVRVVELYNARQFDRLLGRPLEPEDLSVTVNDQAATVAEVESAHEKVRIYRID